MHEPHPTWLALAALVLLGGCSAPPPGDGTSPNILLIVLDTQRADRLGCHAGPPGLTPFLDRLATRSVVFQRAYAQSPWTLPSIASLFTSRLPSQNHVHTFADALPVTDPTLADVLAAAGYATGGFSANSMLGPSYQRGFQAFMAEVLLPVSGVTDLVPARAAHLRLDALDWVLGLPEAHRHRASFLYLQFMESHYPLVPDPDLLEQVARSRGHPTPELAVVHAVATVSDSFAPSPEDVAQFVDAYDAALMTVDRQLARLFADLERLGFLDHAVVVVTADHGEELRDHGHVGHGTALFEEQIHVPLLLSLPGQTRRIDVEQVVSLIDVGPTLLDLAGIEPPMSFEGRSLRATIEAASGWWGGRLARAVGAEQPAGERAAFSELLAVPLPGGGRLTSHTRSIVLGHRKLIECVDRDPEVFDLWLDPYEREPRTPDRDDVAVLVPVLERLGPAAPAAPGTLDRDTEARLRALGYLQ